MPAEQDDHQPQYTRYRAGPRLLPRREGDLLTAPRPRRAAELAASWRERVTLKRVLLGLLALLGGWLALSGPSRSDTIMLIRTGGGHSARLSIPRDTVVEIPGHGLQKINAAYAFGGPALAISVIRNYLGVPINHVVEVNFEDLPQLVDAMGGVDYTGDCIVARLDGGFRNGGYTLRLSRGTHRLDGKAALALARARENLCRPNETDLQRAEHQQALFSAMKSRLLSVSSFLRLPWIAWNAPPAIISDMSGPTLLGLFGALATSGTPPIRVLKPSGTVTLPGGEEGLSVSDAERRAAVAQFMRG